MKTGLLRAINTTILVLTLGVSMNADAGLFGLGGTSWQEEVLLHDGSKIIVKRTVERGGRSEIGQAPPIKQQNLVFILPATNERVIWEDNFTEDVGGANFLPMLLDIHKGAAYLIADPMASCHTTNGAHRIRPTLFLNIKTRHGSESRYKSCRRK